MPPHTDYAVGVERVLRDIAQQCYGYVNGCPCLRCLALAQQTELENTREPVAVAPCRNEQQSAASVSSVSPSSLS